MIVFPVLIVAVIAVLAIVTYERPGPSAARRTDRPLPGPRALPVRGVVFALARREAWLLIVHPAVLAGIALSGVALTMGLVDDMVTHREALWTGIAAFPLAGMTLIAANLAVLRAQRAGAVETVDGAPATAASRTAAHLLSVFAPAVAMTLMVVVDTINLTIFSDAPGGAPDVFELAHAPILVACAGAVGVLLATWLPTSLVAVPAVVLLGMLEGGIAGRSPQYARIRWLAWWVPQAEGVPQELWDRRAAMHAVYLLGLGMLVAAVALARNVPARRIVPLVGAPAFVVVGAAAALLAPISDGKARALASWVNEAASRQACTAAEGARICAYREYDHRRDWVAVAQGVLGALPGPPARPLSVVQRLPRQAVDYIDPRVTARFRADAPRSGDDRWQPDGAVHPELRWSSIGELDAFLAVDLAAAAVGLPIEQDEHGQACLAADQARSVVGLWLAAHGSPHARRAITSLGAVEGEPLHVEFESAAGAVYPSLSVESWVMFYDAPVRWSARDVRYARALLAADQRQVRAELARRWHDILQPATTSDQLASWTGLPQQPSLAEIGRATGVDPAEVEAMLTREAVDGQARLRGPCR